MKSFNAEWLYWRVGWYRRMMDRYYRATFGITWAEIKASMDRLEARANQTEAQGPVVDSAIARRRRR